MIEIKKQNMQYVVFLSFVAALGGFLFGYDTAVISGTIEQVAHQYNLDAIQQGWYVGCALVGSIVGVSIAGVMSDRFGRKNTMLLSAILFSITGIGCALATNFSMLVWYRIIGGVGIGIASIVSPLYISEVSIANYRGRLVSLYQLAITIGFLGAYLVNYGLLQIAANHSITGNNLYSTIFITEVWRGMLGMEFFPALLFFGTIFFIPESPRWLILKNKEHRALNILNKIYRDKQKTEREVVEVRLQLRNNKKSHWKLVFNAGIFKALIIGMSLAILGQFMGVNAVLYYGPSIFQSSGLSSGDSLLYQVLVGLVNVIGTILAIMIIDKIGRKKLVYYGVSGMILSLLLISFYFFKGISLGMSNIFLLIFFLLYISSCAISICAVIWVLLSEMYPTAIRGLAMSIAGFSLWIGTYLIGQLTPWMFENLKPSGTFLLFALMCIPYILIVWKLIPETKGKTLEQIEQFWTNKND